MRFQTKTLDCVCGLNFIFSFIRAGMPCNVSTIEPRDSSLAPSMNTADNTCMLQNETLLCRDYRLSLTQTRPFSSLKNLITLTIRSFSKPTKEQGLWNLHISKRKWRFFSSLEIFPFLEFFSVHKGPATLKSFRCAQLIAISLTNL